MNREWLLARIGDMRQVAGIDLVEAIDGPERGVRTARVRTGGGLEFVVHIDRGFDIGPASLDGVNLTWCSPIGAAHPHSHQDGPEGWARRFPGGLLTTCGPDNVGPASSGHPLHGTHSATPARLITTRATWDGDRYLIELVGEVQNARLFGSNLVLRRSIATEYASSRITVRDVIENRGAREAPLMLLYHCNFGHPLVDEGAILVVDSDVTPRDADAEAGLSTCRSFGLPSVDYKEQVFHHDVRTESSGTAEAALVNRRLELAVCLRYDKAALPHLTEWKQLGEREYVVGIEPGTCFVLGREKEERCERVIHLGPGQRYVAGVEIECLRGQGAVAKVVTS
jgi:hypothetical protein